MHFIQSMNSKSVQYYSYFFDVNISMSNIYTSNKIDLLLDSNQEWDETRALEYLSTTPELVMKNTLLISAVKDWGLDKLEENIESLLGEKANAPLTAN